LPQSIGHKRSLGTALDFVANIATAIVGPGVIAFVDVHPPALQDRPVFGALHFIKNIHASDEVHFVLPCLEDSGRL